MELVVTIKEAVTKRDLVKFMEFPLKLYKGNPYYVPDILSSQVADMQKDKNPAFAFCQAKAFLAYRDGKIVGRIQGILNNRANQYFDRKYMNFTQVDFMRERLGRILPFGVHENFVAVALGIDHVRRKEASFKGRLDRVFDRFQRDDAGLLHARLKAAFKFEAPGAPAADAEFCPKLKHLQDVQKLGNPGALRRAG